MRGTIVLLATAVAVLLYRETGSVYIFALPAFAIWEAVIELFLDKPRSIVRDQ